MAAGRNKALLTLAGRPLLLHSVETFWACCDRLLVVAAEGDLPAVRALLPAGVVIVAGGPTRHCSEANALAALRPDLAPTDVVAIHDAARPLVLPADVRAVLSTAADHGAAMLAAPATLPALRLHRAVPLPSQGDRVGEGALRVAQAYPAAELWRAQTPQAARAAWLLDAYDCAAHDAFDGTDTAAVLSRAGYAVRIVPATGDNPKVTVPPDLGLAESLLSRR